MSANSVDEYPNLTIELRAIEQAINIGMPVFGICLGSQLIAKALGASIRKNKVAEIGWYDVKSTKEGLNDPLISEFNDPETVFHWHRDTFDIPSGAVHLATSSDCRNQAFRYGEKVYGFQFHLEVDTHIIQRWLTTPENIRELKGLSGTICCQNIVRETGKHIERLMQLSRVVFTKLIKIFGAQSKKHIMPSV